MPKRHIPTGASKRHRTSTQSANLQNQQLVKQLRATNRWRKLSTLTRSRFPQCQHKDCIDLATSVHHIKMSDLYPELFFVGSNLIPLCDHHHALVSQLERANKHQEAQELYSYWKDVYNNYMKQRYNTGEQQ